MTTTGNSLSQFGRPRGWLGRVVGAFMGWGNKPAYEWTLPLLHLTPTDRVLEIGFGPGVGVEIAADIVDQGLVAGIDLSDVMLEQARKRNARAIAAGRVALRLGSVAAIPYADSTFDKAYSNNVLFFWPDLAANLREVYRVLKPGGISAQTVMKSTNGEGVLKQFGATLPYSPEQVTRFMTEAGFRDARVETMRLRTRDLLCFIGTK